MADSPEFNRVGDEFVAYYETIRGHVREVLTRRNLQPYVNSKEPLLIADIGGGDGRDTLWLAEQGHSVVLADVSDNMLKKAESKFAKIPDSVKSKIALVEGSSDVLLDSFGPGHFDLVLSHGVLMYELKDPQKRVDELFELVRPLGHVSLLTKGYEGARSRFKAQHKHDAVRRFDNTNGHFANRIGAEAIAYTPEKLDEFITHAGGKVLEWYGVRIMSDDMYGSWIGLESGVLAAILEREATLGTSSNTKAAGQMLHFIAQRTD